MFDKIVLLRGIIHRLVEEIESYPEDQEKSAEFFQTRVKDLRTAITLLSEVGDQNFVALPLFSFNDRLLSKSRTMLTNCGYKALRSYLDTIKPSLNNPIPLGF